MAHVGLQHIQHVREVARQHLGQAGPPEGPPAAAARGAQGLHSPQVLVLHRLPAHAGQQTQGIQGDGKGPGEGAGAPHEGAQQRQHQHRNGPQQVDEPPECRRHAGMTGGPPGAQPRQGQSRQGACKGPQQGHAQSVQQGRQHLGQILQVRREQLPQNAAHLPAPLHQRGEGEPAQPGTQHRHSRQQQGPQPFNPLHVPLLLRKCPAGPPRSQHPGSRQRPPGPAAGPGCGRNTAGPDPRCGCSSGR